MADVSPLRPDVDPEKMAAAMEAVLILHPGRPLEISAPDARIIISILRGVRR